MVNTLNMQDIRYLNLFSRITRIDTRHFFKYNEHLVFGVPRGQLSRAIGEKGSNVRQISQILRKRVKIVALPNGIEDAKKFIEAIINPVTFRELNITDKEIVINAGSHSKAALIGRNKRRLLELAQVVENYFGKELRIV